MPHPAIPTRPVTVLAQDPSVTVDGRVLRSTAHVAAESLDPGPRGSRVQIVDYDASAGKLYRTVAWDPSPSATRGKSDEALLHSPGFHAWNTYAIVMRTLARFEYALGRRIEWSTRGQQLWVAPHAFSDANAFYSEDDGALYFGYVPRGTHPSLPPVFTCLAHDIVAHETTHALLDGLRERYTDPSSAEQAAFHEGFADLVALLSVLAERPVVDALFRRASRVSKVWGRELVPRRSLALTSLETSPLFGIAEQLGALSGDETASGLGVRRAALRNSIAMRPEASILRIGSAAEAEEHDLGEVLVAALMRSYVRVWRDRVISLSDTEGGSVSRARLVEEAANLADRMLTVSIRALDYLPVVDVQFADFVAALLTADAQVFPDDSRYHLRRVIPDVFYQYGVHRKGARVRPWDAPDPAARRLRRGGLHFGALQTDKTEIFRMLWENRTELALHPDAFVRVQSVRPCMRQAEDGAFVRETVVEYVEWAELRGAELRAFGVRRPRAMPADAHVTLHGGGALILDEFGDVKVHVKSRLASDKQARRVEALWEQGFFRDELRARSRGGGFAERHMKRLTGAPGARF